MYFGLIVPAYGYGEPIQSVFNVFNLNPPFD